MKSFKIKCDEAYCKNHGEDGYCNATVDTIKLNDVAMCSSYDPFPRCGECAKFRTTDCRFAGITDAKFPVSMGCFEATVDADDDAQEGYNDGND